MLNQQLTDSRYRGDYELLEELRSDETVAKQLSKINVDQHRNMIRAQLLSSAVRVEANLLPNITQAFDGLKSRAGIDEPMEAYVYEESAINAFVARGRTHTLVGLSSGAVMKLSEGELEFVIGHELGHSIFEHLDVHAGHILESGSLSARQRMQILAWQRSAEISADRSGLICCGSIDTAATALFKSLSGLSGEISISPASLAGQWDQLVDEVISGADGDQWQLTHPFPPLRMKAMIAFWESDLSDSTAATPGSSDAAVDRLLAMMDPLAREDPNSSDPVLENFFLWGGLYLAVANGEFQQDERSELKSITSAGRLDRVLADGVPTPEYCLDQFTQCYEGWTRKLTAIEMHRIVQGLLQIAFADGDIDDSESEAFKAVGKVFRITEHACESLIAKYNDTGGVS